MDNMETKGSFARNILYYPLKNQDCEGLKWERNH